MNRRTDMSDKKANRGLWESLNNFDVVFDGSKTMGRLDSITNNQNRVESQTSSHRIKVLNCTSPDAAAENLNSRKLVKKA